MTVVLITNKFKDQFNKLIGNFKGVIDQFATKIKNTYHNPKATKIPYKKYATVVNNNMAVRYIIFEASGMEYIMPIDIALKSDKTRGYNISFDENTIKRLDSILPLFKNEIASGEFQKY